MPLKTPKFWYKKPGIIAYALLPLAWIYQIFHRLNQALNNQSYQSSIPVICIGNAVAGGSGKTPTAISLMNLVKQDTQYKNPVFLMRGYGGEIKAPFILNPDKHTLAQAGDEAFLLARVAPTIISPNRADGARLAEEHGADLIIMDDGLQNKSLQKDISFLVIDRAVDFGNGKTIPAGPLREPLSYLLPKIDSVICIGRSLHSDKAVFDSTLEPTRDKLSGDYIAFAGLGRPEKFLHSLQDMGANITGWHSFPDHHLYTTYEIDRLLQQAEEKNATLITTEKDYVRLPDSVKDKIETLPVTIKFKQDSELLSFIKNKLNETTHEKNTLPN